jgi:glycosyltransferase involved in cell wall biosynthesis
MNLPKCVFFSEIKNYETQSLVVYEKELLPELSKLGITYSLFAVRQTRAFQWNPKLNFLISGYNRHLKYPLAARKQFRKDGINHILHSINATMLFLKPKGCTTVITCHDIHSALPREEMEFRLHKGGVARNLFQRLVKRSHRRADFIITISEHTKKDLMRLLAIPEEKIRVILPGVNHSVFKPRDKIQARERLGLPEDDHLILNVSSDEPRKNVETLIEALRLLSNELENVKFVHIGALSKKSQDLVQQYALEKQVINHLRVNEEELAVWYCAADVFVFPSFYEGFGLPPLEAMASGCPVICSDRASLPEVVGKAALLIDPRETQNLVLAIKRVLMDTSRQAEMVRTGLEQAAKFSWAKAARQCYDYYEDIGRTEVQLETTEMMRI